MYCRKYELGRAWLDISLKSSVLEDSTTSNMVKWSQTLLKSGRQHLYHIY